MAKKTTAEAKKRGRPSKEQDVTKKIPSNKKTDKKTEKKNILTSEKKANKKPIEDEKTKKIEPIVNNEVVVETKIPEASVEPVKEKEVESINPVEEVKEKIPTQNNSSGIMPVEDDETTNEINTVNNNAQKVYTCKKGAVFMDSHLKIGINDTNISRRSDTFFDVFGKSEHGADFKTEFECMDKEEGDILSEQLSDYEKNPSKYIQEAVEIPMGEATKEPIKSEKPIPETEKSYALDANGNIDMTKLSAAEIMSIQNGNMGAVEKKATPTFEGVPVTAVNIEDMINNLPPKVENQNINPVSVNVNSTPLDISGIIATQSTVQMDSYGKSVEDLINTSFQAMTWGGMPQNDVRLFLKNCDAQYTYDLINDGKGFLIIMKKGDSQTRLPKNPSEYLKVQ